MPLEPTLQTHMQRLLETGHDGTLRGNRLLDDASRLWQRVRHLTAMKLIPPESNLEAMELACYALQLPLRQGKALPGGKLGQISLRERAEQAAELLIGSVVGHVYEQILDQTTRLLRELPQRSPTAPEARLLADAINLDDFGLIGLVLQAMNLSRQSDGISQLVDGFQKRQAYGYWDARLKDGFHFEPVRQMARQRLEHASQAAAYLLAELQEDQQP